jgi:hypothetical protein
VGNPSYLSDSRDMGVLGGMLRRIKRQRLDNISNGNRKVVLMRINLSPQRRDDTLEVIKTGDVLTVNGEDFDFSPIGDGDTLPASAITSEWFFDKVDRIDGKLVLTLILPNPFNYSHEQAFPVPLENVPDGLVVFPGPLPESELEMAPEGVE